MSFMKQLREANIERDRLWDPENKVDLGFRSTEFGGEAGEVQNKLKKIMRERLGIRGTRASVQQLADELADVIICADLIAMEFDLDLERAIRRKFNETSHDQGFDVLL